MSHIIIATGQEVIIDEEYYPFLSRYSWYLNKDGYAASHLCGREITMHRMLLNCKPKVLCDHKDGNRLNNRIDNLRNVDRLKNAQNVSKHRDNKSGYKGVFYDERRKKYRSKIMSENIVYHLGYFETALEAARAYNEAATKYHGDYARLNVL